MKQTKDFNAEQSLSVANQRKDSSYRGILVYFPMMHEITERFTILHLGISTVITSK
jgi:hypothetical protein